MHHAACPAHASLRSPQCSLSCMLNARIHTAFSTRLCSGLAPHSIPICDPNEQHHHVCRCRLLLSPTSTSSTSLSTWSIWRCAITEQHSTAVKECTAMPCMPWRRSAPLLRASALHIYAGMHIVCLLNKCRASSMPLPRRASGCLLTCAVSAL